MANLLKNAIAEAKEVKALALANAKLTLEETFQPTLQRMISSKISEEEGEEFEEEPIEDELTSDDFGGSEDGMNEPAVGFGDGAEEPTGDDAAGEEELEFSDDDLEEEINRIMSEMDDDEVAGEEDFVDEGNEEDWEDPNPETDELTEEEINEILGEEDCEDDTMEEITEDDGAYDDTVSVKRSNTEGLRRQNSQLKKDLNEALRAITTMKTAFNEVNLLNARLMYSQKVFKDFDLNKDQRLKVLEAFDRANSVREVKSKYADMLALLNGRKQQPKRNPVNESASKSIKQVNPTPQQKQSLNESFNFVSRWQELANIKK